MKCQMGFGAWGDRMCDSSVGSRAAVSNPAGTSYMWLLSLCHVASADGNMLEVYNPHQISKV